MGQVVSRASKYPPVRSVRVDEALWARAKRRAKADGVTMSDVMFRFVEGYAKGMLNLPKVQVVYERPVEEDSDSGK
jgi:hypothetical protein